MLLSSRFRTSAQAIAAALLVTLAVVAVLAL